MSIKNQLTGAVYVVAMRITRHDGVKRVISAIYDALARLLIFVLGTPFIPVTVQNSGDFKMFVDLREPVASLSKVVRKYETPLQKFYMREVTEGMNVADVGSNKGFFLFLAAQQVGPSGSVTGFEPESRNYRATAEMIRGNGFDNVSLRQSAVSNETGEIRLVFGDGPGRNTLFADGEDGEVVEQTRLDDEFEPGELDLIKIDIEGAEWAALRGAENILSASSSLTVCCEVHPPILWKQDISLPEFVDLLEDHDMDVSILGTDGGKLEPLSTIDLDAQTDEFHVVARKTEA